MYYCLCIALLLWIATVGIEPTHKVRKKWNIEKNQKIYPCETYVARFVSRETLKGVDVSRET